MAKKTYWNGIIVGVSLAILIYFAAGSLTWLSWLPDMITKLGDFLASYFPESITSWEYYNYLIVGAIGFLIGLWVEWK